LPNGYAYEQTGDEPFDEQYTTITVYGEDGQVKVVARSEFTFGGRFSVVVDWFAADSRQSELQRTLLSLAEAIDEEVDGEETATDADSDEITADEESTTGSSATQA
jgi:hypothetical protein